MNAYPKRWQALNFLIAGAFLSPLDYFIVNMALPSIKKAFRASDHQLQMVIAIYGLTYAALVVCGGSLRFLFLLLGGTQVGYIVWAAVFDAATKR